MKMISIINNGHDPSISIVIRDYQVQSPLGNWYRGHLAHSFFSKAPLCRQKSHLRQLLPNPSYEGFVSENDHGTLNQPWFALSKEEEG